MKKQLYGLHMKDGSDLLEHLNMFNMLNTQLSSFGFISIASYTFGLSSNYFDVWEGNPRTQGGDRSQADEDEARWWSFLG